MIPYLYGEGRKVKLPSNLHSAWNIMTVMDLWIAVGKQIYRATKYHEGILQQTLSNTTPVFIFVISAIDWSLLPKLLVTMRQK